LGGQTLTKADPLSLNELGLDALDRGDTQQAIQYLSAATAGDPSEPALWMNLAKAQRIAGNDRDEQEALQGALAIDQLHLMARLRLAELHERRGEVGAATDHWGVFLGICSTISNQTAELRERVGHAQAFVEARREALAKALDHDLATAFEHANERDRRRARAAADLMLGRRSVYANHCHGFHYPFLPADEFFDRSHFSWLERLEAATPEIRAELKAILASPDPGLSPYIEMPAGTPKNLWSELDKSSNWSALHLWRDGQRINAVCDRAPATAALMEFLPLAQIPGRAPAVFFSILKAGKRIPPHTGVTNIRSIVHLGLIVPQGCGFRVGGEVREWREGEAFVFDDTIEHEAWNDSGEDRAVLILDCWNPYLSEDERAMIIRMFAIAEAQRPDRPVRG
jgi:aspartyl/asparaginyl beta-hydroxylase (cupin superfamily)